MAWLCKAGIVVSALSVCLVTSKPSLAGESIALAPKRSKMSLSISPKSLVMRLLRHGELLVGTSIGHNTPRAWESGRTPKFRFWSKSLYWQRAVAKPSVAKETGQGGMAQSRARVADGKHSMKELQRSFDQLLHPSISAESGYSRHQLHFESAMAKILRTQYKKAAPPVSWKQIFRETRRSTTVLAGLGVALYAAWSNKSVDLVSLVSNSWNIWPTAIAADVLRLMPKYKQSLHERRKKALKSTAESLDGMSFNEFLQLSRDVEGPSFSSAEEFEKALSGYKQKLADLL